MSRELWDLDNSQECRRIFSILQFFQHCDSINNLILMFRSMLFVKKANKYVPMKSVY